MGVPSILIVAVVSCAIKKSIVYGCVIKKTGKNYCSFSTGLVHPSLPANLVSAGGTGSPGTGGATTGVAGQHTVHGLIQVSAIDVQVVQFGVPPQELL